MILTYKIQTAIGICTQKLPFLSESQMKEFNSIGYSGKTVDGKKMTRIEYLTSLNIGEFLINQTKWDHGDFTEEFIITFVPKRKL